MLEQFKNPDEETNPAEEPEVLNEVPPEEKFKGPGEPDVEELRRAIEEAKEE